MKILSDESIFKCFIWTHTVAEVFEDEQLEARGAIEHHLLQSGLDLFMPSAIPKLSITPGETRWLGPQLGAHNAEILEELGLDAGMIKKVCGEL